LLLHDCGSRLLCVSAAAIPLEALETLAHGLDHPEGICATPDGSIYVGGEAGQIYRLEEGGGITEILSTAGFILGMAADGDGRIYAIDSGPKCVWRIDPQRRTKEVWAEGPPGRPFTTPNWGAFDAAGNYYLSDSGDWGGANGCLWRIPPGGGPELWSESVTNFPNGLALSADGKTLYVLESLPGALVEVPLADDGSAGERRLLCDLDPMVPDGVALTGTAPSTSRATGRTPSTAGTRTKGCRLSPRIREGPCSPRRRTSSSRARTAM
jgi:gluconolactonase